MLSHRAFIPPLPRLLLWLFCVVLPLCAAAFLADGILHGQPPAWDIPLMMWVHTHIGAWFEPLALLLHYTGKPAAAVPLTAAAAVLLYFRRYRAQAVITVLGTLLPTLNMYLAKNFFGRPRPELWPRIVEEGSTSFPSGHSTFAAAVAVLAVLLVRRHPHRRSVYAAALLFAFLTGLSRVYLGVHYPSDVLAGWINGALTAAALCLILLGRRQAV